MSKVDVVPVSTKSELNEFIDIPWSIYPPQSLWVPPLKTSVRRLLDTRKHPFWETAEQILFLARRGGEAVGRIAGIIDRNYNQYHNSEIGMWGFFECRDDPEAAEGLLSAVERWVSDKGMTRLMGPFNPSTNYEVGMLIEGFEYPPVVMMPYNHSYYERLVQGCGFTKEKDLLALKVVQDDRASQRIERLARRVRKNSNISVRPGSRRNLEAQVALLAELYCHAWSENWGFVPLTAGEIHEMARNLLPIMEEKFVTFFYYGEDPAGVMLLLPDVNPILKSLNGRLGLTGLIKMFFFRRYVRGIRGVLLGIKKQYQKLGLPFVAVDYLNNLLRGNMKYEYLEFGWNLEDNVSVNKLELESGARIYKRYRIFGKSL